MALASFHQCIPCFSAFSLFLGHFASCMCVGASSFMRFSISWCLVCAVLIWQIRHKALTSPPITRPPPKSTRIYRPNPLMHALGHVARGGKAVRHRAIDLQPVLVDCRAVLLGARFPLEARMRGAPLHHHHSARVRARKQNRSGVHVVVLKPG